MSRCFMGGMVCVKAAVDGMFWLVFAQVMFAKVAILCEVVCVVLMFWGFVGRVDVVFFTFAA